MEFKLLVEVLLENGTDLNIIRYIPINMKQIVGFPRYTITSQGTLYDLNLGRELSSYQEANGYLRVCLTDEEGRQFKRYMHRLIAMTYLENPENLPVVDHINRDKSDNRVENLRWSTFSDNSQNYERRNVHWDSHKKRWIARRMVATKLIHIGCFEDIEDAMEAVEKFKEDGTKAKAPSSSTGHKNIYAANGGKSWYVNTLIDGTRHIKRGFASVEEAVAYRDSL